MRIFFLSTALALSLLTGCKKNTDTTSTPAPVAGASNNGGGGKPMPASVLTPVASPTSINK